MMNCDNLKRSELYAWVDASKDMTVWSQSRRGDRLSFGKIEIGLASS